MTTSRLLPAPKFLSDIYTDIPTVERVHNLFISWRRRIPGQINGLTQIDIILHDKAGKAIAARPINIVKRAPYKKQGNIHNKASQQYIYYAWLQTAKGI